MKKVTSEQLVVGRTYYAHDDQTTPLTFVKYDEYSCPCFTQPKGGCWREQTDGLCHFGGNLIFCEIPQEPALTLQEKFEQGWEFTHKSGAVVIEMFTFQNGHIAVRYTGKDDLDYTCTWADFLAVHTITPPAPKVERMFTVFFDGGKGNMFIDTSLKSLEAAKEYKPFFGFVSCILEHEKQGDKWVFVKAHTV